MVAKNPPANAGDVGSVPGSGRPGEGNGNPLPMFLPGESYGPGGLRSMGSQRVRQDLTATHNKALKIGQS